MTYHRYSSGDHGCRGRRQMRGESLEGSRFGGRFSARFGGGARRGRMFTSDSFRLLLLALIAEAPRHGYDIIKAIETRTGGAYAPSPGVVYPTLTLLADMGLVAEAELDGARRSFSITDAGKVLLAEQAEAVAAIFARLDALAAPAAGPDRAPVTRAMENLASVLRTRLADPKLDRAGLLDMAALIDEAAAKIERL